LLRFINHAESPFAEQFEQLVALNERQLDAEIDRRLVQQFLAAEEGGLEEVCGGVSVFHGWVRLRAKG
jgi:hypothetical protein